MKFLYGNKQLMKEWNYKKNNDINPNTLSSLSHKKVWWICENGHEWQAIISNRSKGAKCPYCSGKKPISGYNDLFSLFPELIKEWNYKKNTEIAPNEMLPSSHKKVWWKCKKEHEWQATIDSRTRGNGCPFCSGRYVIKSINDFQTIHPELINEWDFDKNTNIKPDEILPAVNKKVWWKCDKGHKWQATVNNRHNGTGCPICGLETQSSFPEQIIMFYFQKQLKVENRYKFNGKEIDIYLPELSVGIEYDGAYYHNSEKSKEKEQKKDKILNDNNIFLIRIKESNQDFYDKNKRIIYYKPKYNYENLKEVIDIIIRLLTINFNQRLNIDFNLKRDTNEILASYKNIKKQNSLAFKNKRLLNEWNYEKNKNLNPDFFDVHSGYKVWWKCKKGHEWQASIDSRTRGNGCPYCSGLLAIPGENDFKTLFPNMISEWNYNRNYDINPSEILPNSERKVWWICKKGHEWQATIGNRTRGTNCPYCSNKKVLIGFNDLKTWCENNNLSYLINEFDYEKNIFSIDEITYGSGKKVWWICSKNHSYQTFLTHRTQMLTGCPFCSNKKLLSGYNDLATTHPEIAREWTYDKNDGITPKDVMAGSNKRKYWFDCPNGHSYKSTLLNRKNGRKCPICYKNEKKGDKKH